MAILPYKFSKETLPEAIPCPKRLAEQLRFAAIFLKFLEYFVHSGTEVLSGIPAMMSEQIMSRKAHYLSNVSATNSCRARASRRAL